MAVLNLGVKMSDTSKIKVALIGMSSGVSGLDLLKIKSLLVQLINENPNIGLSEVDPDVLAERGISLDDLIIKIIPNNFSLPTFLFDDSKKSLPEKKNKNKTQMLSNQTSLKAKARKSQTNNKQFNRHR
jgi:hypothetical protein